MKLICYFECLDKLTRNIDKSQHIITNHSMTKKNQNNFVINTANVLTITKKSWPGQVKIEIGDQVTVVMMNYYIPININMS